MDESTVNARLDHIEDKVEKMDLDIRTLFGSVNGLAISDAKLETMMNNLLVAVGELKGTIEGLKAKPGDRWDKIVYAAITALVAAAVAYFVG